MKLNEKGLKRLLDVAFDGDEFYQSNALEVEFEPDDFQGGYFQNGKDHIALTVEEAEKLMKLLDLCEYWLANNNVSYDCDAWASLLEGRIEQAEKKDE